MLYPVQTINYIDKNRKLKSQIHQYMGFNPGNNIRGLRHQERDFNDVSLYNHVCLAQYDPSLASVIRLILLIHFVSSLRNGGDRIRSPFHVIKRKKDYGTGSVWFNAASGQSRPATTGVSR